jgi:hypothetical protein
MPGSVGWRRGKHQNSPDTRQQENANGQISPVVNSDLDEWAKESHLARFCGFQKTKN